MKRSTCVSTDKPTDPAPFDGANDRYREAEDSAERIWQLVQEAIEAD